MYELRWNPQLKWWVMYSSERQHRPLLPKDYCPFCPGSKQIPFNYDVLSYPNDWPILNSNPPAVHPPFDSPLYQVERSWGKCEVILYSPDHNQSLGNLPLTQIEKLINLWQERFKELAKIDYIKYVFIFENRGEEVGVTIHHPHGQIYAYPFIPKKIEVELESAKEYEQNYGKCLYCEMLEKEIQSKERIVDQNSSFVSFVPFFAEYPYQVFIFSKKHIYSLLDFGDKEKKDLAVSLKKLIKTYDKLFDRPFPYMMCFHQIPTDGNQYPYYHFHIEFYPPLRNSKTQKFNASAETGSWTNGNPTSPEEKADELREIMKKIEKGY